MPPSHPATERHVGNGDGDGDDSRTGVSVAPFRGLFIILPLYPGLLTAFGRRDAPSPASGRWPAIPGLGPISLPPAG